MEAHLLSLNNFNMPRVLDKSNANYMHIVYLLLLDKGTFQSHPNMGVGLRSEYRYNNDENMLDQLREEIREQITTYLPQVEYVMNVTVGFAGPDHVLGIVIEVSDGAYVISYDQENDDINVGSSSVLSDLISN